MIASTTAPYPYPVVARATSPSYQPGWGTGTYLFTYTMTGSFTFSKVGTHFSSGQAGGYRVGIYRGDLSSATLMGDTNNASPGGTYDVKTITVKTGSGQSLTFLTGQQVVVAYTLSGGGAVASITTGPSNVALAAFATEGYASGGSAVLPHSITEIGDAPNTRQPTTNRVCLDFA